jgi:hypothetical protein
MRLLDLISPLHSAPPLEALHRVEKLRSLRAEATMHARAVREVRRTGTTGRVTKEQMDIVAKLKELGIDLQALGIKGGK